MPIPEAAVVVTAVTTAVIAVISYLYFQIEGRHANILIAQIVYRHIRLVDLFHYIKQKALRLNYDSSFDNVRIAA